MRAIRGILDRQLATMTPQLSVSRTPNQSPRPVAGPTPAVGGGSTGQGRPPHFELKSDSARMDSTVEISPAGSVKRHCTGQNGLMAESIFASAGSRIELRFKAAVHLLVMYDRGAREDGETSIEGVSSSKLRHFSEKLTFVPAGHAYYEWHEVSTSMRVSVLYLDARVKPASCDRIVHVPRILFDDPVLWKTAAKLKTVIERNQARGIPYSEALAQVLVHELPQSEHDLGYTPPRSRGGLATWQACAVSGYVERHLSETISLATLARLTRLSEQHFCRAFKKSFGLPPHQFHVQRRIERAKLLLSDRANTVTDIALMLGYSQTSTFSVAFRKTTGRSPREFRRDFA
jgi:AraC family transcriptional regulator